MFLLSCGCKLSSVPHPHLLGESREKQGSPYPAAPRVSGGEPRTAGRQLLSLPVSPADFRSNFRAPPIRSVDVYNIMCSLAGIQPLPNNGSWSRVECMLRNAAPSAPLPSCALALALLSLVAEHISSL